MKKRLIDIYPPHTREQSFEDEDFFEDIQKTTKGKKWGILLLIFLVPALLFFHFFFAKATIVVWPQITKLHMKEYIEAQVGYEKLNLEKKIIRARVFEEEKQLTQLFGATGKKFKEEKAQGTIRVYNESALQTQPLVANTRFVSEDGKVFRLLAAALVPKGFLDVRVQAAAAGSEYNIGPSKFSLPGLAGSAAYTKIYGESFQPMSGGENREILVVTEEDIAAAKDELVEALKTQAVQLLLSKIPPQFQVLQDSLEVTVLKDTSLVKPGAELDQFNYTASIKVRMLGFHKEDAEILAHHLLQTHLGAGQTINRETTRMSFQGSPSSKGTNAIPILVDIQADQYQLINKASLSRRMAGVSQAQMRQVVPEYPFLAKIQFSLWPFWISKIPKDADRIRLDVRLDS